MPIKSSDIGSDYPKNTGRLKIIGKEANGCIKVALCGDSTIDNGYWVDRRQRYIDKTNTVPHQIAFNLDKDGNSKNYQLANFAVDGATTSTMLITQNFKKVLGEADEDHPDQSICQLEKIQEWKPNVAVLSVGGNNYRLAFQGALPFILSINSNIFSYLSFMFRFTPRISKKLDYYKMCVLFPKAQVSRRETFNELVVALESPDPLIRKIEHETATEDEYDALINKLSEKASSRKLMEVYFKITQETLHREYKEIIDGLVKIETTKRLVISSQYYPALTPATLYFIYTGFAHLAHSKGLSQSPFQVADEILHEFYKEVLSYAAKKDIEIVFADVTSSMSPLGGYCFAQIEPNKRGSALLGKLMAQAIELEIPEDQKDTIPVIRLNNKQEPDITYLKKSEIGSDLKMKSVEDFIQQDRYRHIQLLFARDTSILDRIIYFYEFLVGKQFDNEYTGLHAFGLLDLSLVTIAASYLWRVAVNEQMHISLRLLSGLISVPILMVKYLVVLALALALILTALTFVLALALALLLTALTLRLIVFLVNKFINLTSSISSGIYNAVINPTKDVSSSQEAETENKSEQFSLFANQSFEEDQNQHLNSNLG